MTAKISSLVAYRCCMLLLMISAACAASYGAEAPGDESPVVTTEMEKFDSTHSKVSDVVETMARRIDRFFADERAFEEDNISSLQLRLDLISDEDRLIQFESRLRTKLILPGTERRLRLIIESDPEEVDPDTLEENLSDTLESSSNYIIGLEAKQLQGDWRVRPSVGIRARWPPELYTRVKATRYIDLNNWLARVSGTASWFSSDGVSLAAGTDFDRGLNDKLLFRSASNVRWEAETPQTSASQVFSLFQRLASKASLAYDVGVVGDDNPAWRVTNHFIRLRYRRLVYRTWAYLEIQPKATWPEENDFREELSLLLRLELNFGRGYR